MGAGRDARELAPSSPMPLVSKVVIVSQQEASFRKKGKKGLGLGLPDYFEMLSYINMMVQDFVWWLALGVASTAGFGFGLPTGATHLFPLVATLAVEHGQIVPALQAAAVPMSAWAIGSALGELPPFLLAHKLVHRIPDSWMERTARSLVQRLGAFGVFGLACWPSVVFDVAGVAAGVARMPAGTFVFATTCGKLVKTPIQSAVAAAGALQLWNDGEEGAATAVPDDLGLYVGLFLGSVMALQFAWRFER